ncbi:MAG: RNase J family beta-CASP ribonuclease [archaeon]
MEKIEICTIGGYCEVGKNMTAIKYGEEVIICDMGFYLPKIIAFEEEGGNRETLTREELIQIDAIPDDSVIRPWFNKVKAIVCTHCHLDHIGAVPYMASDFNCPIIGTPFTIEVLKRILDDEDIRLPNKLRILNPNSSFKISKNITIEFLNMTHSTPQTVMIVIHTPRGAIVYANDFKFDNHPVIGRKPNYQRLKELGKEGAFALIADSLYAGKNMKTPSEKVAREMLKDVMLGTESKNQLVVVTTFASHIARLKSVIDFGKKMHRKIVFIGRSLDKYVTAAEAVNIVKFRKDIELIGSGSRANKKLKEISKNRGKYLLVCTGNQGEPRATLTKMTMGEFKDFKFEPNDQVIFSCKTIPAPINQANRALIEDKLMKKGVRIFKDIHTSGHASREDHRDLLNMLKPKHLIPAHGDVTKLSPMADLGCSIGYVLGKTAHILRDGQIIELS